jgi:hypothetical protein
MKDSVFTLSDSNAIYSKKSKILHISSTVFSLISVEQRDVIFVLLVMAPPLAYYIGNKSYCETMNR